MKILCVLPCLPLPCNTGGRLRTLHLLRALDAAFEVTVLSLDRGGDAAGMRQMLRGKVHLVPRPYLRRRELLGRVAWGARGLPLNYEPYASPEMCGALAALLKSEPFDVVHFDHLHTAQMLPLARKLAPKARLVIDEHNVEAQVMERLAPLAKLHLRPLLHWQAKRIAALEGELIAQADTVLACSARDRSVLQWRGASSVRVVPNGVDVAALSVPPAPERKDVVFVGSMDWWPNSDAAQRLVEDIWPLAQGRLPGTRLTLVGRNPPASLRSRPDAGIVVTGTVDSVKPYLASAWATAIPLRAGSGTRLKILEAAAAGVPLVCSRLAAEGLPLVDGESVLYAETAAEFAEALIRLHGDVKLQERLTQAGKAVAQHFDWSLVGAGLAEFYRNSSKPDASAALG